ncbi:MAG: HAMP domain-containing sensor histidine kinase, partial [Acidobacteriota bacterium]
IPGSASALAATGEMAANIAHEIKNPLGSISGSAQMLRREAVPGSREYELLGIIHSESNRLSQTLQNFLSFVQPGPQILKNHDLVALAREVWTLFRNDPSHSLEALTFKESFPTHRVVAAVDQDRFRQAMWNLLQNARKAINGPGTITLSLSLREPYAILEVKDTGKGIPKSEIPKYFEPFRRGFRSGSGLGLSVVYRIMEQHGGLVEMDSTYGKGTVCRLLFPLVRDDA